MLGLHSFQTKTLSRISFGLALLIATILAAAAWGKFFYPAELLKTLDRWVSLFEVLFLLVIIFLRNRWQLWMVASLIFALWAGYALFWFCLKLPCSCMGEMLDIPRGISIAVDVLFSGLSLWMGYLLGAKGQWIYLVFLAGLMAALLGFAFADFVYRDVVVRM